MSFSFDLWMIPRGLYPTPFLGYLVLWLGSPIWKSRYLKKRVRYDPIGMQLGFRVWGLGFRV